MHLAYPKRSIVLPNQWCVSNHLIRFRYNLWYKAEGTTHYMKKSVNGTASSAELEGLCELVVHFRWCVGTNERSAVMGRVYEILLGAENVEGLSTNATEQLVTPVGNPEGEPLNVQYEIVSGKVRPDASK